MLSYCLCRKNTESNNTRMAETNKGKLVLLSTRTVCDSKKNKIYQKTRSWWTIEQVFVGRK